MATCKGKASYRTVRFCSSRVGETLLKLDMNLILWSGLNVLKRQGYSGWKPTDPPLLESIRSKRGVRGRTF